MAATTTAAKPSRIPRESASIGPGGPWHKRAPRRVCRAYESQRGWPAWCKHLADRNLPAINKLLPDPASALTWALPEGADSSQALKLTALLGSLAGPARRKRPSFEAALRSWLGLDATLDVSSDAPGMGQEFIPSTTDFAPPGLECLAWCGALPQLAAHLPEGLWWQLLNRLTAIAADGASASDDPLAVQLLRAELPLAIAYSFPELEVCQALADVGRRTLAAGAAEMLDGEGLLHCRYLHLMRPLLACWTRCGAFAQAVGEASRGAARWENDAAQYPGLLEHALRLSRANGQPVFASLESPRWNPHLLKAALHRAGGDPATRRLLRLAEKGAARSRAAGGQKRRKDQPSPSFQGEWAGIAMLRSDWTRTSPRLAVTYGRQVAMELSVGPRCLWSGTWGLDVRFNGRPLAILGDWEQVAWESDDGVDYLELELQLSDEITVQRHIILARSDAFVFLADAVLGIQQGTIEYHGTLPLKGFSRFQGAVETREGSLAVGRRPAARVLPLALGEWRSTPTRGSLHAGATGLELAQSADGQSLLAPLFIDLSGARLRKEATWRQLTVAQKREIVPRDVAVGYRVQAGKSQWLVYRSLAAPDVRTVLGSNLAHEFLVGQFTAGGRVDTLLEIEAAP